MKSLLRASPFLHSRAAACLLVALVAFFTYQSFLRNDFTGSDTLTLIQSGRLQTIQDLAAIFSERMMSGTTFEGVFYRPISVLSFQFDYLVWGTNPFGYHLTNLFLHILVTVATFLLSLRLTRGMLRTSLLAALLFTSHPLLVETVPAIARRQDVLEALFLILSFRFYLLGRSKAGRRDLATSLGFFILALGTKETAIQIPGLIFAHAVVFPGGFGRLVGNRWIDALRSTSPFLLISIIYLVWRFHVLGGLGEDLSSLSPLWITGQYFTSLLYPQNFLYLDKGPQAVTVLVALVPVLVVLVVAFVKFLRSERGSGSLKLYVLLVIWILLPLPILVMTGSFAYRSLYSTIVPFSLLLSLILAMGLGQLREMKFFDRAAWRQLRAAWRQLTTGEFSSIGLLAAFGLIAISLVAFTPLIRDYPQWRKSGVVARQVLTLLSENLEQFPRHAVLKVNGLPRIGPPESVLAGPGTHSVSYLRGYSIQSWLDLLYADQDLKVVTGNPRIVPAGPFDLDLQINRISSDEVEVTVVWHQPR